MSEVVAARLDKATAAEARRLASERGVGMSTLVASAVMDLLVEEELLDATTARARLAARDTRRNR